MPPKPTEIRAEIEEIQQRLDRIRAWVDDTGPVETHTAAQSTEHRAQTGSRNERSASHARLALRTRPTHAGGPLIQQG